GLWHKCARIVAVVPVELNPHADVQIFGAEPITAALRTSTGSAAFAAEVRVERTRSDVDQADWDVQLVNTSSKPGKKVRDTNLYECEVRIVGLRGKPFLLESLPKSFRYDRRVSSYGINCGSANDGSDVLVTSDVPTVRKMRPVYWNAPVPEPNFSFHATAADPST